MSYELWKHPVIGLSQTTYFGQVCWYATSRLRSLASDSSVNQTLSLQGQPSLSTVLITLTASQFRSTSSGLIDSFFLSCCLKLPLELSDEEPDEVETGLFNDKPSAAAPCESGLSMLYSLPVSSATYASNNTCASQKLL